MTQYADEALGQGMKSGHSAVADNPSVWKISGRGWIYFAILAALVGFAFYPGIKELMRAWNVREEYSYGYLIPFITAFLIWQKKDVLERLPFTGSWAGIWIICLGAVVYVLGSLIAFSMAIQYALLAVIAGAALSLMGWKAFRLILVPILFLAFMIPLPGLLLSNLSTQLQLISSMIGVEVTRLFGVSVYLEGNVIDLGNMKLQVVEACSGLRYLFPLMSLSFICAYIFRGPFWKKATIFISSIPITVFMNSFRIGAIGVLVEYRGPSQAEGFLHDFEGWAIFMTCFGIILIEMWMLSRVGGTKLPLKDAFSLDLPAPTPADAEVRTRDISKQYLAAIGIVAAMAVTSPFFAARAEIHPGRTEFSSFPMTVDGWVGKKTYLEKIYLDSLRLDDYLLADYYKGDVGLINLYVAYYASQKIGESAHSPRVCIPGGGWQIKSLVPHKIETGATEPLLVNRLVIQKGDDRQLVYYWFQQRGRVLSDEYMVKWYLLRDAITRRRTDGSLVRLVTPLKPGEDPSVGDQRLGLFAKAIMHELPGYIPD